MTTLYGITIDNANDGFIADQAAAISTIQDDTGLGLTVRVVFDEGTVGADWVTSVEAIPSTGILGMLLDSTAIPTLNVTQYGDRATDFLGALGGDVTIWEIGNEVNGNWTGDPADVAAKCLAAFNVFNGAGKATAITVYYNPNGVDGAEPTPQEWTDTYLDGTVRNGVDYVLISYYEVDFDDYRPDEATVQSLVEDLHALYPNAQVGFGEVGLDDDVTGGTLSQAQDIMAYYYALNIPLPYYCAGYFWWYGGLDVLAGDQLLFADFESAIESIPSGTLAPTVTSLSPTHGLVGDTITLTGTGFSDATDLQFGGVSAPSWNTSSDTDATAEVPSESPGNVSVQVISPEGTSAPVNPDNLFHIDSGDTLPTIDSVNPSSGPTAGGTTVTITGSNYTSLTGVTFGGVAADSPNLDSDTQITAVSPAHAAGTVAVIVTTDAGSSE